MNELLAPEGLPFRYRHTQQPHTKHQGPLKTNSSMIAKCMLLCQHCDAQQSINVIGVSLDTKWLSHGFLGHTGYSLAHPTASSGAIVYQLRVYLILPVNLWVNLYIFLV